MKFIKIFICILLFIFITISSILLWSYSKYQQASNQIIYFEKFPQNIEVKSGATTPSILKKLADDKLINDFAFIKFGWFLNKLFYKENHSMIQKGEYFFDKNISLSNFLDILSKGKVKAYKVTLLEGFNIKQVREALKKNEFLIQTIDGLEDDDILKKLNIEASNLEGMFFPDTYVFQKDTKDLDILKKAHESLKKNLQKEWLQRDLNVNLPYKNPYDALIMASIIEKETGKLGEREKIAGVFVRRLLISMRLQTDPTVIYGMGNNYNGKITRKDLQTFNLYNTYTIDGMPPTPIALASLASIRAALHPDMSEENLYFVAKGDGSHVFSKTLNEHNKSVREYQLKRKSDYKSY